MLRNELTMGHAVVPLSVFFGWFVMIELEKKKGMLPLLKHHIVVLLDPDSIL